MTQIEQVTLFFCCVKCRTRNVVGASEVELRALTQDGFVVCYALRQNCAECNTRNVSIIEARA